MTRQIKAGATQLKWLTYSSIKDTVSLRLQGTLIACPRSHQLFKTSNLTPTLLPKYPSIRVTSLGPLQD